MNKNSMNKIIQDEIKKLVTQYIEDKLFLLLDNETIPNASHINNGYCRSFAFDLVNALTLNKIDSVYQEVNYKGIPHAFVKIGEKYYDSECATGVKDWKRLPIFSQEGWLFLLKKVGSWITLVILATGILWYSLRF